MPEIFGRIALAADEIMLKENRSPREAWAKAAKNVGAKESMASKGCPKNTFLSLCQDGFLLVVPPGDYHCKAKENREYARAAVQFLRRTNEIPSKISPRGLWENIVHGETSPNGQMDVVLALWNHGRIRVS